MIAKRFLALGLFALLAMYGLLAQKGAVEVFEIGRNNLDQLPAGKEADGIIGDYVLRNTHVEALVGGNLPLRRANMSVLYDAPIPGTLYDLDLRDSGNDQLTAFRPGGEKGAVSWVRAGRDSDGGFVEAVRTAVKGAGLHTCHEYRLEPDWRHILVTSTYGNEGSTPRTISPAAVWHGLMGDVQVGEIRTADSVDPYDKRGYAWAPTEPSTLPAEVVLQPGDERVFRIALAVSNSPLEAYGVIASLLGKTGRLSGGIRDSELNPAERGALVATLDGQQLRAYIHRSGRYQIDLPEGSHRIRFEDIGREPQEQTVTVSAGGETTLQWNVSNASRVVGSVRGEDGRDLPAKVQFLGRNGTATPNFGTDYRTHGGNHQYQTHNGRFDQQVPPGDYLLRFTHGPEYELVEREISVKPEQREIVSVTLRRVVDTTGWISTDFHAHSTPSGDNYCNTTDRIINFAAEQIEFAPTTEHNRIFDWKPEIDRLRLSDHIRTVPGIELTGRGQHFNAFPLTPDPTAQNGGAPLWDFDPRINAIVLREWSTPTLAGGTRHDTAANTRNLPEKRFGGGRDRWVQANHPNVQNVFFDRNEDGVRDGGFSGFEELIDAAEVWSSAILNNSLTYLGTDGEQRANRTFMWLQMLNQSRHVWCVAVSDAHRIFGNGVGNWRTYVPSSTDNPSAIDPSEIIRNAKAGRMMITNGPFLEVTTTDGLPIGSSIQGADYVDLVIKVQAPNWVDLDRVQILLSGRQPERYNFRVKENPDMFREGTVRFEETIRVELQQDEHLIVVATDEDSDLSKGWGLNPQGRMAPTAFTNPIYVDTGHDGFQANGDTLGQPLPTAGIAD